MEDDLPVACALDPERAAPGRSLRRFASLAGAIADQRPVIAAGDDLEIFQCEFSERCGLDGRQHFGFGISPSARADLKEIVGNKLADVVCAALPSRGHDLDL